MKNIIKPEKFLTYSRNIGEFLEFLRQTLNIVKHSRKSSKSQKVFENYVEN
jgi:hypothetical protein